MASSEHLDGGSAVAAVQLLLVMRIMTAGLSEEGKPVPSNAHNAICLGKQMVLSDPCAVLQHTARQKEWLVRIGIDRASEKSVVAVSDVGHGHQGRSRLLPSLKGDEPDRFLRSVVGRQIVQRPDVDAPMPFSIHLGATPLHSCQAILDSSLLATRTEQQ